MEETQGGGGFRRAFVLRVLRGQEPRGGGSEVRGILGRPSANFWRIRSVFVFLDFSSPNLRELFYALHLSRKMKSEFKGFFG